MTAAASADLRRISANLGAAAGSPMDHVQSQLLAAAGAQVAQTAAGLAPKRTGELSNSIQARMDGPYRVVVGPVNVKYGVFQEFGTGERGEFPGHAYDIYPKKPGGVLVFKVGDKTVFARHVHHPGIPPHPFMRPALLQVLGPLAPQLAKAGALMITKGPNA